MPSALRVMSADYDPPEGGTQGELLSNPEPAPPAPAPWHPDPPDWTSQLRPLDKTEPERPPLNQVAAEWVAADTPEDERERYVHGPPLKLPPLERFVPPPPDWRREEAEAEAALQPQEPAASLQARPAPKTHKERTPTPNLDRVRAWRRQ